MKIAILGCGPAGLLAALACHQMDHDVTIYSKKKKSVLGGSQYLHVPILHVTDVPSARMIIRHVGTPEGYAQKVYGNNDAPISWHDFAEGEYDIWNLRQGYEDLWVRFSDLISDTPKLSGEDLTVLSKNYDVVFSSIPRSAICKKSWEHSFLKQRVWIEYDHHADHPAAPDLLDNQIVYNGNPDDRWYRSSNLFGIRSTEFSKPLSGAMEINKPLFTDCNCFDRTLNVKFIGRYGEWKKGRLTHHAYYDTLRKLDMYAV